MSKAARELAKDIEYPEIEERFLSAIGREVLDEIALKIDAAVAPLVEALEDCVGMLQSFTGSRYDEEGAVAAQISDAEQALAAWRE